MTLVGHWIYWKGSLKRAIYFHRYDLETPINVGNSDILDAHETLNAPVTYGHCDHTKSRAENAAATLTTKSARFLGNQIKDQAQG